MKSDNLKKVAAEFERVPADCNVATRRGGGSRGRLPASGLSLTPESLVRLKERLGEPQNEMEALDQEAMLALAAGASPAFLRENFDLTQSYVELAFLRKFGSIAEGKKVLLGLVLENAIACNMHAAAHIDELTPRDALAAGAVLTEKVIKLDEHVNSRPQQPDFEAMARLGAVLERIDVPD